MVGIRSVTYHLPQYYTEKHLSEIARLSRLWDRNFSDIRTQRVCLSPFAERAELDRFKNLSDLCDMSSIRWFNVPIAPKHSQNLSEVFHFSYSILCEYSRAFVNVLGVDNHEISVSIFRHYASLMRKISLLGRNGKDNFRLGMSMNVQPDGAFFPFTYSSGLCGCSIALELTQEINEICNCSQNSDLLSLRKDILKSIVPQIKKIYRIAQEVQKNSEFAFKGFDFSLAPVIGKNGSIITILNRLGIYDFGKTGTLFATGYLTNILKHLAAQFPSVGFSGVMYSLLEDLELCSINNERGVTLDQLISLSTMCGCGVDMVPVYGQISNEELMSIFLDVAGISCRLNKPLGIRILPIPQCGRSQTYFTKFQDDSDFIANTKVVDLNLNLVSDIGQYLCYLNTTSERNHI